MTTSYTFVDADSILYRSAYEAKTDSQVIKRYKDRLNYIQVQTFSSDMFVAVKGFNNFRDTLDTTYKGQRPEQTPEMRKRLNMIAEYAIENGAARSDGWEADDQVRAWSFEADEKGIDWVIAGIDKDLLQIPGLHFNYGGTQKKPLTEEQKWNRISQEEGDFRFAAQLLTGDTVDNIKGIYRIGEKKAEKLLAGKSRKDMMSEVVELYKKEFGGDWERKLYVNCNLIYMRRWLNDEFLFEEWLK